MTSLEGILPFTKTIGDRIWVPRSDSRYSLLAGNGEVKETCGKWMTRGCLNSVVHQKYDFSVAQRDLSGVPIEKFLKRKVDPSEKVDVIEFYKASCGRLQCPVCYEKAAARAAIRIAHRVMLYDVKGWKPFHWTVSVPEKDWGLKYSDMRKKAYQLAMEAGIVGGCIIPHPFRKYNEDDGVQDLKEGFSWNDPSAGDFSAVWYISFHFHGLGYGWVNGDKVKEIYERTGWIVRNLGVRKPLQGQTMEDAVRGTAHYQLSHCGVNKKFHTVVWFGALTYRKLKGSRCPDQKHECPICHGEMCKVKFLDPEFEDIVKSSLKDEGVFMVPHGLFEYVEDKVWRFEGG